MEQAEIRTQVCLSAFPSSILLQDARAGGAWHGMGGVLVIWTPRETLLGWGEAQGSLCCCCDGPQECGGQGRSSLVLLTVTLCFWCEKGPCCLETGLWLDTS